MKKLEQIPSIIAFVRLKFAGPVKNNIIINLAYCDIDRLRLTKYLLSFNFDEN